MDDVVAVVDDGGDGERLEGLHEEPEQALALVLVLPLQLLLQAVIRADALRLVVSTQHVQALR